MDQNGDLLKGVVNKLQSVIDREEASDPASNLQRCLPLDRRSSEESEDQQTTSTLSALVSSEARLPSYPSSTCSSRPESSPDAPTASISNPSCSNWSNVRNCLDEITLAQPSTASEKHTRKKIFKKKISNRAFSDSPSTSGSEIHESFSTSDQSPECKIPVRELSGSIKDPVDLDSETPKLKRKRSLEVNLPSRKTRRFNSLDESIATSNRLSPKLDGYQVEKPVSPGEVQSISDTDTIKRKKPLKRRISSNEKIATPKKLKKNPTNK